MDETLFTRRPRISHQLWVSVLQKVHAPPVQYLRKMGLNEARRPLPSCTLDMFFSIDRGHPDREYVEYLDHAHDEGRYAGYIPLDGNVCRPCGIPLSIGLGSEVCRSCGNSFLHSAELPSAGHQVFGGPVGKSGSKRVTTYMYKRTNHFIDHLKRVQAKETRDVKKLVKILQTIESELRKERLYPGDPRITTDKVRSILKKLKLQKHYIHVFYITSKLSNRSPPILTPVQEEKLLELFHRIQTPFEKHCPPDRTNMLNYIFILRKLTQIMGWYELMEYFPLLKSRSKIYAQDMLWKKICQEVDFPFHRSIA